ncbi:MAG: DUF4129 domain-containing protein [Deltaproteobacteria bacterium]
MTEPLLIRWSKRAGFAALLVMLFVGPPRIIAGQENSTAAEAARHDVRDSPQAPLNLPEYMGQLDQWASALETVKSDPAQVAQLRRQLPERWPVAAGEGPIQVSTSWLRAGLNDIAKDPGSAATAAGPLLQHVRAMRREAQDLLESRILPDSTARGKLDKILAQPEFGKVHGPTWLDRMADRISDWLDKMLERFGTGVSGHPRIVRWMFWLLLIGAAGVLLVWMTRRLLQRTGTERLSLPSPESDGPWSSRDLARQARAAAARGDFREATRFAYWAGIHRLEERGLWTADPARTHREYLRLVGSDQPQRQPLEALTRQFERVWYALEPASEGDYQFTVEQWERLGCAMPLGQTTNRS